MVFPMASASASSSLVCCDTVIMACARMLCVCAPLQAMHACMCARGDAPVAGSRKPGLRDRDRDRDKADGTDEAQEVWGDTQKTDRWADGHV
jgi:hypothetical protein